MSTVDMEGGQVFILDTPYIADCVDEPSIEPIDARPDDMFYIVLTNANNRTIEMSYYIENNIYKQYFYYCQDRVKRGVRLLEPVGFSYAGCMTYKLSDILYPPPDLGIGEYHFGRMDTEFKQIGANRFILLDHMKNTCFDELNPGNYSMRYKRKLAEMS